MSDNKCKWRSKHNPDYRCKEPITCDDYCILHYSSEDKKAGDFDSSFEKKVREKIDTKEKEIDLKGCYFPKDFPFDYFVEQTFDRPVNFSEATFSQGADFSYATLSQADFSWAAFLQGADFIDAEFSQANFSMAKFSQGAYFFWASFSQEVDFSGAEFSQAYFLGTTFAQADFSWAEFKERVLFLPIRIEKGKKAEEVILGPSKFYRTRFLGEVVFEDVDLSECSFLNSNIDKVDFRYCKFGEEKERKNVLKDERDCDEKVKKSDKGPFPYNGRVLIDTKEEKEARQEYEPVHRLYLELKKNFEDKKDWNTAGDFHYGEMECRRNMKGWWKRNIFSLEALYYWASGYGERPWRALACIVGLIPFCMFFYWLFDFATGYSINPPTTDSVNAVPTTASQVNQPSHGLGYWFWYSLKAAFLWRFGETGAEPSSVFGKGVFFLESVLGPLLIALFILALRRKVKR